MPYLSPTDQFEALKRRIVDAVTGTFPIVGKKHTLRADRVWADDNASLDDINSQKSAKFAGRSWDIPINAELVLVDNSTGKAIDKVAKVRLLNLPKITRRYSYIVKGVEYQPKNLFRLKAGVYSKISQNGELVSDFNLAKGINGRGFSIKLDPGSGLFYLKYKSTNIILYPILKTLGVDDSMIENEWGRDVAVTNQKASQGKENQAVAALYKSVHSERAPDGAKLHSEVASLFSNTVLRPDSTKLTIGEEFDSVTGRSMVLAGKKLLAISRSNEEPDDRDSLIYKDIVAIDDFLYERIANKAKAIKNKVLNQLDSKESIRDIVSSAFFTDHVTSWFTQTDIAEKPSQLNPLEFVAGQLQTTFLGEGGGISDIQKVSRTAQEVNPSHLGFLDPIHTPEGEKTGINLHMTLGTKKVGRELKTSFYSVKLGKLVDITPGEAYNSVVAFTDQYKRDSKTPGHLIPKSAFVRASFKGNVKDVPSSDVVYVIPNAAFAFDMTTNMIPFLQNNHGARAFMGAKQMQQAISIESREEPLVQTLVSDITNTSFEKALGEYNSVTSPVAGKITKISDGIIYIKAKDNTTHHIQFYRDFPLNEKQYLDSELKVKVGDEVKAGQLLADTNFTKNGVLSLGTNLRVAYMPFRGLNFEDGIVISESAAKKLTSNHMYKFSIRLDPTVTMNLMAFRLHSPNKITSDNVAKLDNDGVIKKGETVKPGDIVLAVLRKRDYSTKDSIYKKLLGGKGGDLQSSPQLWDEPYEGLVTDVVKEGRQYVVFIKTKESAEVGDKLVGRSANKGIITRVLPDHEMPRLGVGGDHIEVLLNPAGIPGRINMGQVFETVASKVAEKTGKTYMVRSFSGDNYFDKLKKELSDNGLSDTEELIDPTTDKSLGQVLTGKQYMLKLVHQVGKKASARSRGAYDASIMAPSRGTPGGGQRLGELGLYALLAHGSLANLREMQTIKSSKNDEVWYSIIEGMPLPAPETPFAFNKFLGYMNALGINVEKKGNELQLSPFTDEHVKGISNGVLTDAGMVMRAKDLKLAKGGLFDPAITGGLGGEKWSHIVLNEPLPNPIFEGAILKLLRLKQQEFNDIVAGHKSVDGRTGGEAIKFMLSKIDVDTELTKDLAKAKTANGSALNVLNKRIRYLRSLKQSGLSPTVYVQQNIPVLPPIFRPLTKLESGDIAESGVNKIYRNIWILSDRMKDIKSKGLPPEDVAKVRASLYDAVKAIGVVGTNVSFSYERGKRKPKGILETISGSSPKYGYFQQDLLKRRQDFTARSLIVPEPSLGLDEVGIPEKLAWEVYKPFVIRRLGLHGIKPLAAMDEIDKRSKLAEQLLEKEMQERPVLLKRDPVLHRYGVQSFNPKLVKGQAIQIHPLSTSGYNADFDGDMMSIFVPVTQGAVDEANKMHPSDNLFSAAHGKLMFKPEQESQLGLYLLTKRGKKLNRSFSSVDEIAKAFQDRRLDITDVVTLRGAETTLGTELTRAAMPKHLQTPEMMRAMAKPLDKKNLTHLLTLVAQRSPKEYGQIVNRLKDMGNETAKGFSFSLKDFETVNKAKRDELITSTEKKLSAIDKKKGISDLDKEKIKGRLLTEMAKELKDDVVSTLSKKPTNLSEMVFSGARGDIDQMKQLVSTPAVVENSQGQVITTPIRNSYSEGLSMGDYWAAIHAARTGMIRKTIEVREPGVISKQMTKAAIDLVITMEDCGTDRGVSLPSDDREIIGRYLAVPVHVGNETLPKNTLVDGQVQTRLVSHKIPKVIVRSPMRCEAEKGICRKCHGHNEKGTDPVIGTNIGVIAAQSLGEPTTQLALKAFHTGSLVGTTSGKHLDAFSRLELLLNLPEKFPGAATLSRQDGKVDTISPNPAGGWNIVIKGDKHYVPGDREVLVMVNNMVKRGDRLSSGEINPRDLLHLKGIGPVQNYLTDQIYETFVGMGPINRRHAETIVRSITNTSKVIDPGGHDTMIPGDIVPTTSVEHFNRKKTAESVSVNNQLLGQVLAKPYKGISTGTTLTKSHISTLNHGKVKTVEIQRDPIEHEHILRGINLLPLDINEDWLARLHYTKLTQTIADAAAEGWKSNIHGTHPVPGLAYGAEFGKPPKGSVGPY